MPKVSSTNDDKMLSCTPSSKRHVAPTSSPLLPAESRSINCIKIKSCHLPAFHPTSRNLPVSLNPNFSCNLKLAVVSDPMAAIIVCIPLSLAHRIRAPSMIDPRPREVYDG